MNKTQRREKSSFQAVENSMKALDWIEAHEKECGVRWAGLASELESLRTDLEVYSERWKKLRWVVLGTLIVTAVVLFTGLVM